jgi:hypothetical protein
LFNKFDTEPALFDIALFFDNPDIIRASGNAIFTADTSVLVYQNDSIFPLMGSSRGTDLHTGRIVTMLALNGQELTGVIRECPVFPLLEMIIRFFIRKIVLILTGHSTGVTAYAFCFIDDHSVPRHESLPLSSHLLLLLRTMGYEP